MRVGEGRELVGRRLRDLAPPVADADDDRAARGVEVLAPVGVDDRRAVGADGDRRLGRPTSGGRRGRSVAPVASGSPSARASATVGSASTSARVSPGIGPSRATNQRAPGNGIRTARIAIVSGTARSAPIGPMITVHARIDTIVTTGLRSRLIDSIRGWST